jgi:ABC-type antimicrobial peptide transport system permease subunit
MMRRALAPVAGGLLIGFVVTNWVGRLAEAQLFQVKTRDPMILAGTAIAVAAVALLAAYASARHASRTDPISVLKAE